MEEKIDYFLEFTTALKFFYEEFVGTVAYKEYKEFEQKYLENFTQPEPTKSKNT